MFKLFGVILLGVACGWLLRRKRMPGLGKLQMVVIALLLLVLGVEVTASQSEMDNLFVVLATALVVAVLAILGSLLGAWILGKGRR